MHGHETAGPGPGPVPWLALLLLAGAVLAYLGGVLRLSQRGTAWPLRRLLCWLAGWTCVGVTQVGPLAEPGFTAHTAAHVLLGMLAPLLLVSSAPVTLLLRALPAARARPVARVLAARPAAVLTHPVTAALLNLGGLWLLYRTGLYAATLAEPWLHVVVSGHVLAAGYLFTFAVLGGPDPAPHRAPALWRVGVLVAAVAAHNVLAKSLYATPPAGVPAEQARQASQLMYYAGAPVEIALIVLLCASWLGVHSTRSGVDGGRPALTGLPG